MIVVASSVCTSSTNSPGGTMVEALPARHDLIPMLTKGADGQTSAKVSQPQCCTPFDSLPAYSPELNPIERVWLYLRERYLSHRLFDTYDAILDACCAAWNALLAETGRITSLAAQS